MCFGHEWLRCGRCERQGDLLLKVKGRLRPCLQQQLSGSIVLAPCEAWYGRPCQSCVVRIAGQELTTDLVVLDMVGHDIILGLDWLADIMLLWTAASSGLVYPGRGFCYCDFVAAWVLLRHLVWAGDLL